MKVLIEYFKINHEKQKPLVEAISVGGFIHVQLKRVLFGVRRTLILLRLYFQLW